MLGVKIPEVTVVSLTTTTASTSSPLYQTRAMIKKQSCTRGDHCRESGSQYFEQ